MLKNYLNTALRHLLKNRSSSAINIVGLALGIACLLIILAVVRYERSYDQFHSEAERIYRIVRVSDIDGGTEYRTGVAYAVPLALKEGLASAKELTAMFYAGDMQVSVFDETKDQVLRQFQDDGITFVDSAFFHVFDFQSTGFHWIAGNAESALQEPFTAVLAKSLADKYFPDEDPLGKTLRLDNLLDVKVSGVVEDLPPNTDFPFQIMISYETLKSDILFKDSFSNWYAVGDAHQTYIQLNEGANPEEVEAQIHEIHKTHVGEEFAQMRTYKLQPLKEVHTDARFGNYRARTVSQETIWALLIIGVFIICTAVINFVNLSTAHSVLRSKEVGIRKTMGSNRRQLVFQFLGETFMLTFTAGMLALGAAELVMVYSGDLLQIEKHKLFSDPATLTWLLTIIAGVALLAGMYPALMMSGFNPIAALRNKIGGRSQRGLQLRRGLVTLQFVIAQVFIIGTIVVISQMDYFRNADLGFEQDAVITIRLPEGKTQAVSTLQTLENRWKAAPAVKAVSFASTSPAGLYRNTNHWDIRKKGAPDGEENFSFERQAIDEQYLELFQIPVLAGRNFNTGDTLQRIILNRRLSERLGFLQPADAIGEIVLTGGDTPYTVIGVVENFHTQSLRKDIDYVGFIMAPDQYHTANVKFDLSSASNGENLSSSLKYLETEWAAMFPEYVFDYDFLDESIAAYYQEEARLSQLFKILAGITIFIGCLGLYGLVAFMAVRRTKEVGIRKVLGASVQHILFLFSKEFVVLIMIAFCIAGPIALYIMRQWLQHFTYRIDISITIFLVAIASSLLIAILTVSYQSFKAAIANPVDSLRNE